MTEVEYLFLSPLPPSCQPPILGVHGEGDPYLPHTFTQTLAHTHAHTSPELSRDRLVVTQRCPVTSDLPESSERAHCWLTTEIQLPNQDERQKGGAEGEREEREKFI